MRAVTQDRTVHHAFYFARYPSQELAKSKDANRRSPRLSTLLFFASIQQRVGWTSIPTQ
jgi:hypothetical protein